MAITGHKGGLGKALFDHFKAKSFVVSGFSRTNGYDISAASCREQLVQNISECDLFINNAHSGWGQVELLYSVFEIWNNKPKHIINIGSNSGDGTKNYVHNYAIQKSALDKATEQLNNIPESRCRVTTIRPGWIQTDRVKAMNLSEPQLSLQEVVSVVEWIVGLPNSMHIPTMSILAGRS
jgi:hypothetical protein